MSLADSQRGMTKKRLSKSDCCCAADIACVWYATRRPIDRSMGTRSLLLAGRDVYELASHECGK